MLSQSLLLFLEELWAHNNKDRMDDNRAWYKDVREEFVVFVKRLMRIYSSINPAFHGLKIGEVMFRINKDVRFSKDKSPYKPRLSAYFSPEGKKSPFIGPYIHIQPGNNSFIGGGLHHPEPWVLKAFRRHIAIDHHAFTKILTRKDFTWFFGSLTGESLKTAPQWYSQDHSAIDILRYKSFYFSHLLSDKELIHSDFVDVCEQSMRIAQPFSVYINDIVREAREISDEEIFID